MFLGKMIVNRIIASRLNFIFKSKLKQSQKVFVVTKPLSDKCFYHTLEKKVLPQHSSHITSEGFSSDNLFFTKNIVSRAMSGDNNHSLTVNYDDIVKAQGNNSILIIDVREDGEIQETGKLPGSIHIPMNDVTSALNLSNKDFEEKYCKKKPNQDDKIFLSCRSGRRSAMVQAEIQKLGYSNSYNYEGGWLDWESKQQ